MAKLTPFQYLVLKHPKKDDEQTESTVVLLESKTPLLVKNQEQAMMTVARLIPETEMVNIDRIEFFVRPF